MMTATDSSPTTEGEALASAVSSSAAALPASRVSDRRQAPPLHRGDLPSGAPFLSDDGDQSSFRRRSSTSPIDVDGMN
ncbi:hypothetical protein M6B38_251840 [Iris pallida]|uniref:Uncharacterized protein n=1 Tax=Iris pallida TaxID=29817 RepID=A0AAX6IDX9_IRIPA|nr:hypothetical protein M6B38_416355 [Iris pallida]KAJ6826305.1 hypothetical protein M6B38_372825 [Iris pallida]KAJ6826306.1 hypothetical protein M6B38_372830 [Iris pallida]KAJ6851466.1 hypothetical protein M6B38_259155 [Iris pallida]KAJ6851467.1 hypothetical protein M6B38_259160 [Iris pallida]